MNAESLAGEDREGYRDDLWEWSPATGWMQRTVERAPRARAEACMVFDGERCLLFGGVAGTLDAREPQGDLWAWDGERWTPVEVDGDRPSPRHLAAFA